MCIRYAARVDVLAVSLVDLAHLATEAADTLENRPPDELAQLAIAVEVLAAFIGGDPR